MTRGRVVLLLCLCVSPRIAWAQSTCVNPGCTPIDTWNCGVGGVNFPTCNADAVGATNAFFSRSYVGAIGPNGEETVRTTHIGTTDTAQEYYRNNWQWTVPSVTQGQCRYHRLIIRFNASIAWNDDAGGRFGEKFLVQGEDGTNDVNRWFANFRSDLSVPGGSHEGSQILMRTEKNVDGPPSTADIHDLTDTSGVTGGWHYFQWEICSSTTTVTTNGSIKVWDNTNTYASPTAQSSGGFAWDTTGWERVALDLYGESLGLAGNAVYDIAAYEYDDQFDTNWYRGAGGGGGTRYRFRFRAATETMGPTPAGTETKGDS